MNLWLAVFIYFAAFGVLVVTTFYWRLRNCSRTEAEGDAAFSTILWAPWPVTLPFVMAIIVAAIIIKKLLRLLPGRGAR